MSSAEPAPLRVALLSPDLMVRSRVAAQLAPSGVRLETPAEGRPPGRWDLLLVDLNRDPQQRLAWLDRCLEPGSGAEVVCFGPHTELAELHLRARGAGAGRCLANSHLGQFLQRWIPAHQGTAPVPG